MSFWFRRWVPWKMRTPQERRKEIRLALLAYSVLIAWGEVTLFPGLWARLLDWRHAPSSAWYAALVPSHGPGELTWMVYMSLLLCIACGVGAAVIIVAAARKRLDWLTAAMLLHINFGLALIFGIGYVGINLFNRFGSD